MTSVSSAVPKPFFPKEVIAFVGKLAGLTFDDMVGTARKRYHVRARAVAVQVLAGRGLSLSAIGRLMKRDHSTICNLYHHFKKYYADDELAQAMLNTAKREFLPQKPKKAKPAPPPEEPSVPVRQIVVKQEKRFYDFSSIPVGEARAYWIGDQLDAQRVRKAAHNRNAMADVYYRTKTIGNHIHVIRIR